MDLKSFLRVERRIRTPSRRAIRSPPPLGEMVVSSGAMSARRPARRDQVFAAAEQLVQAGEAVTIDRIREISGIPRGTIAGIVAAARDEDAWPYSSVPRGSGRRNPKRRALILECASRIAARGDVPTVRRIATEAELTQGSVYHYVGAALAAGQWPYATIQRRY